MFSANENIALRQYKRRVVSYVESTIPEHVLDAGTSVMAMQVQCRAPGCAPLETVVCIIFPRLPALPGSNTSSSSGTGEEKDEDMYLMPGVTESHKQKGGTYKFTILKPLSEITQEDVHNALPPCFEGGTYKFTILKPLSEITQEDVHNALPPCFEGGTWTVERMSLEMRDVMLNQLDKALAEGDAEGRALLAEYLQACLKEYVEGGCVLPELGQPFPENDKQPQQQQQEEQEQQQEKGKDQHQPKEMNGTSGVQVKQGTVHGGGNFVIRLTHDNDDDDPPKPPQTATTTTTPTPSTTPLPASSSPQPTTTTTTPINLRDKQKMNTLTSSATVMQRMAQREHPPGIRRRGCPCCDPDNVANVVDSMMLL